MFSCPMARALRFEEKALLHHRILRFRSSDRERLIEHRMLGSIDYAHPSRGQKRLDKVAPADRGPHQRVWRNLGFAAFGTDVLVFVVIDLLAGHAHPSDARGWNIVHTARRAAWDKPTVLFTLISKRGQSALAIENPVL